MLDLQNNDIVILIERGICYEEFWLMVYTFEHTAY